MAAASYDKGDLVRVSATFQDTTGAFIDPTTVKFDWRIGTGTVTTYTYPTTIVKDSVGNYHVDIDTSAAPTSGGATATYYTRFYATGTGQASQEYAFDVTSPGGF